MVTSTDTLINGGAPAWVRELRARYASGVAHAFVLHFGVRDYVAPGMNLRTYLDKLFHRYEIVVHYDRSEGITFFLPSMKADFVQSLGLEAEQNDALAALRAVGGAPAGNDVTLPSDPAEALPLLERLLRQSGKEGRRAVVVIDYAETIAPASDKAMMGAPDRTNLVTLCRWGVDPEIAASGNVVILITNNLAELSADVRAASAKYEAIEVPLPTYDERLSYVNHLATTRADVELAEPVEAIASATAGLSRLHVEDIWLRAASEGGTVTRELVRERKRTIIASEYADVIEVVEPTYGFELIGGLAHVKQFFVNNIIRPMANGNTRRVPMGVLLTGPAGTGKTALAMACAKEAGVNMVLLKPERILGGIVGTSEKNLEKALRAIESMTPCLVFIDEIDQKLRRGEAGASDGGSSVNNNLFSRLLEFASDTIHRGRVVFLAATNRPDLLDAALKRPGRFDKKVPFLVPNEGERVELIKVMARKYKLALDVTPAELADVARATDGWTGAELEALTLKAWELAEDNDEGELTTTRLLEARRKLTPSTADIELMTALALRECNDLDLLPEAYRERAANRAEVDKTVETLTRGKREL